MARTQPAGALVATVVDPPAAYVQREGPLQDVARPSPAHGDLRRQDRRARACRRRRRGARPAGDVPRARRPETPCRGGAPVALAGSWLSQLYGQGPNREWTYGHVPRRVVVEELLLGADGGVPDDYKFFVFHGTCRYISVDRGRFARRTQDFFTPDWSHVPLSGGPPWAEPPIARPERLAEMLGLAELRHTTCCRRPVGDRRLVVAVLPPRRGTRRLGPSLCRRSLPAPRPSRWCFCGRRGLPRLAAAPQHRRGCSSRLCGRQGTDRRTLVRGGVVGCACRTPGRRGPAAGSGRDSAAPRPVDGRVPARQRTCRRLLARDRR